MPQLFCHPAGADTGVTVHECNQAAQPHGRCTHMQALGQVVVHSWVSNLVTYWTRTRCKPRGHVLTFEDVVAVGDPHIPGTSHIVSHARVARGWRGVSVTL